MTPRTSIITDWRVSDEDDLPDVAPGDEYERVIAAPKFVVLRRILVRDMTLIRLQIGMVEVPFELESDDGPQWTYKWTYKPAALNDDALKKLLIATGAAVATRDSIAIAPGLEVRVQLRNDGTAPTKPRAALLVQEEIT